MTFKWESVILYHSELTYRPFVLVSPPSSQSSCPVSSISQMLLQSVHVSLCPLAPAWGPPSALAQVTVPASQVALSQVFIFFQSIFQTAARVIFLKCLCCHQVTPLIKNYGGFCAFRKKFKLLNLCGFSCLGPTSFHSHLLPLLICDILFYFRQEIKCGAV